MIYLIFVSLISMSNAEYTFGMRSCEEADEKETFAKMFKGAAETDCASYCLNSGPGQRYRCFVEKNDKKATKDKISAMIDVLQGADLTDAIDIIRRAKDLDTAKNQLSARYETYSCQQAESAFQIAKREYETAQAVLTCKEAPAKRTTDPQKQKTSVEQ